MRTSLSCGRFRGAAACMFQEHGERAEDHAGQSQAELRGRPPGGGHQAAGGRKAEAIGDRG
ncbi:MAG: hypothetical protein ACYC35_27995 [Pirellulales bacterium]